MGRKSRKQGQNAEKGEFGYLDQHKKSAWIKAVGMMAVPLLIFIAGWIYNQTRMSVVTVVAVVGCLPGCNQIVHAIVATRYHSIDRELYEETEQKRGDRLVLYENIFTSYEKNYRVDCLLISGRDLVGYTSDKKMDIEKAQMHIEKILKDNFYRQNVKIFTDKEIFMKRMQVLVSKEEEKVPFHVDERFEGLDRDQVIREILLSVSL